MKALVSISCLVLFVGCDQDTQAKAGKPEPPRGYAMTLTISDERGQVVLKKELNIPNTDYVPELVEDPASKEKTLRWYEGSYGGGFCHLNKGWVAIWSDPTRLAVIKKTPSPRPKFVPTVEEPYPGAPTWRGQ